MFQSGGPDVHRIAHPDIRRTNLLQTLPGDLLKLRNIQSPMLMAEVSQNHQHGTRRCQETHPISPGQGHTGEGFSGKKEVRVFIEPGNPSLFNGAIENSFIRCQRCGMGYCRLRAFTGATPHEQEDRFELCHLTGNINKVSRSLDIFQVHKYRFGLRVFGIVFEYFALIDIYFVAESGNPGDTKVFPGDNIAHGMGGEVPRLGNVGDISPGNLTEREKTRGEMVWGGSVP
ncbi:hypothetical protein ES703_89321 [subsurface metagenome]